MRVRVEEYSGHKVAERPRAFYLGERRVAVEEVLDRWYGEDHDYFKVRGDDGYNYILRRDRGEDTWEMMFMGKDGEKAEGGTA